MSLEYCYAMLTSVKLKYSTRSPFLTIDPSNTHRLKNSKKQESHPSAGIVVEQLENIQATLKIKRESEWREC